MIFETPKLIFECLLFHKRQAAQIRRSIDELLSNGILTDKEAEKISVFADADSPPLTLSISLFVRRLYMPEEISPSKYLLTVLLVSLMTFQDDVIDKDRPANFAERAGVDIESTILKFSHRGITANEIARIIFKLIDKDPGYEGYREYIREQWDRFIKSVTENFIALDWDVDPRSPYVFKDALEFRQKTVTPYVKFAYELVKGYKEKKTDPKHYENMQKAISCVTDVFQLFDDWSDVYQDYPRTLNLVIGLVNQHPDERSELDQLMEKGNGKTNHHLWSLKILKRELPMAYSDLQSFVSKRADELADLNSQMDGELTTGIRAIKLVYARTLLFADILVLLQKIFRFSFKSHKSGN